MTHRLRSAALALTLSLIPFGAARAADRLATLQAEAAATAKEKKPRVYHFGSQGPNGVFSNHASHSNRLIPVYAFGNKIDLGAVTGKNSRYRSEAKIKELFGGELPPNTVNPDAEYADQSDLYRVQKEAVDRGVKYLFVVWFDGMDWEATRAAAVAKSGNIYRKGKGAGLIFQDYAKGNPQYAYVVTTPTHDKNTPNHDAQTVEIPPASMLGGYDVEIAGPNPWTPGPLFAKAPGYLKGQSGNATDKAGVAAVGRVMHAYTDSSSSAAEFATGVKQYNNGVNVDESGKFVPTMLGQLQGKGWKVGTVTSVPISHASPAAMYAHNVDRDDYQDLTRDMLGLKSIAQTTGKESAHDGLDVVIGTGFGKVATTAAAVAKGKDAEGENFVAGNVYLTDADLKAVDAKNGGRYVVATPAPGVEGGKALLEAAAVAAKDGKRLLGFFGEGTYDHLPYRTADGDFKPVAGGTGKVEKYTPELLKQQPTLADMTEAALTVLARPGKSFALFVEAGDVDWALHDNNLDNAVGAVISGEHAIEKIIKWVEAHSNWDDAALIVTADHGHYLVIDDPAGLAPAPAPAR